MVPGVVGRLRRNSALGRTVSVSLIPCRLPFGLIANRLCHISLGGSAGSSGTTRIGPDSRSKRNLTGRISVRVTTKYAARLSLGEIATVSSSRNARTSTKPGNSDFTTQSGRSARSLACPNTSWTAASGSGTRSRRAVVRSIACPTGTPNLRSGGSTGPCSTTKPTELISNGKGGNRISLLYQGFLYRLGNG